MKATVYRALRATPMSCRTPSSNGSKARDWNDDSDIDVLVIAANGAAEYYKALSNLSYDLRSPPTRSRRQVADIGAGHRLVGG